MAMCPLVRCGRKHRCNTPEEVQVLPIREWTLVVSVVAGLAQWPQWPLKQASRTSCARSIAGLSGVSVEITLQATCTAPIRLADAGWPTPHEHRQHRQHRYRIAVWRHQARDGCLPNRQPAQRFHDDVRSPPTPSARSGTWRGEIPRRWRARPACAHSRQRSAEAKLGTAAGADPELLLPSPPSDGNDCAAVMPQSRLSISRRNRASRSGSLTRCRQTEKQREILVGSDLKSELRVSTRTRKTFLWPSP